MQRNGLYSIHMRGSGFGSPETWLAKLREELNCPLDRWTSQPAYVEVMFEAAAMSSQFLFYANDNVPLLAFHGDVSIPAKWDSAERLVRRWRELGVPTRVLYYGDLDPKGLQIPQVAHMHIAVFAAYAMARGGPPDWHEEYKRWLADFQFIRVGLNDEEAAEALLAQDPTLSRNLLAPHMGESQVADYNIPENPERPGTFQWEALDDAGAQELIGAVDDHLDLPAFGEITDREEGAARRVREHLQAIDLSDLEGG
jgi:hypothetical protein